MDFFLLIGSPIFIILEAWHMGTDTVTIFFPPSNAS